MQAMNTLVPLCVDLDGTLLNSDLLLETVFTQLKCQPLAALHWPYFAGQADFAEYHQFFRQGTVAQ